MLRLRGIITVLVLVAFAVVLAAGAGLAADAKTTPVAFAVIDVEKAFDGSAKKQELEQNLNSYFTRVQTWFELRSTNKLLTPEEFTQLLDLKLKQKPTDADTKKIDELLALSKQREQEYQGLQQKPNATDAEKTRLKELQDQVNKTDTQIRDEDKKQQAELTKQRVELSKQVMADVEAAVASVAKEKGLTMVFNKSIGEPGLVIYANLDITDDVIKKLAKK